MRFELWAMINFFHPGLLFSIRSNKDNNYHIGYLYEKNYHIGRECFCMCLFPCFMESRVLGREKFEYTWNGVDGGTYSKQSYGHCGNDQLSYCKIWDSLWCWEVKENRKRVINNVVWSQYLFVDICDLLLS